MTEQDQRAAVLAEARTWLGTPFHDKAAVKGAGVDCANFVYAAFRGSSLLREIEWPNYSPQWFLHHSDELLLDGLLRAGFRLVVEDPAKPADVVVAQVGRTFSHIAIVIDWPRILHVNPDTRKVQEDSAELYRLFAGRPQKFFSLWS